MQLSRKGLGGQAFSQLLAFRTGFGLCRIFIYIFLVEASETLPSANTCSSTLEGTEFFFLPAHHLSGVALLVFVNALQTVSTCPV